MLLILYIDCIVQKIHHSPEITSNFKESIRWCYFVCLLDIDEKEVGNALKELKNNEVSRKDDILAEILQAGMVENS